jgi:SPP1 gp7 family putative phage head morphogenesis protein
MNSLVYKRIVKGYQGSVYKEFQREKNATLKFLSDKGILKKLEAWSKKKYPDIWEKRAVSNIEFESIDKVSDKESKEMQKFLAGWASYVAPQKMKKILDGWGIVAANKGGSYALGKLGLSTTFKLKDKRILKMLARRGEKITGNITKRTLRDFQGILVSSYVEQGVSPYEVRRRIEGLFENTYRNRSMAIARTETAVASSTSQYEAYKENGVGKKRWLAIIDDRTRPSHVEANGQTVDIDEPFRVGDAEMMHPHDPSAPAEEVINCRCDEIPIVQEKISDAEAWRG